MIRPALIRRAKTVRKCPRHIILILILILILIIIIILNHTESYWSFTILQPSHFEKNPYNTFYLGDGYPDGPIDIQIRRAICIYLEPFGTVFVRAKALRDFSDGCGNLRRTVASYQDVLNCKATCSKHTYGFHPKSDYKTVAKFLQGHFFPILAKVYPYVTCLCILWSFWYRFLCSAYSASTPKNFPVTSLIITTSHTINYDKFLLEHCAKVQLSNPANRGDRFKACIVQYDKTCEKI